MNKKIIWAIIIVVVVFIGYQYVYKPIVTWRTPALPEDHLTPSSPTGITIISPVGGETWRVGQTYEVSYVADAALGEMTIALVRYSDDSQALESKVIGHSSTGKFSYTVPSVIDDTRGRANRYKIEIYPADGREQVTRSAEYFSIIY